MTHYEIVKKLIGEVTPIGDSRQDKGRFDNLVALCELVAALMSDIDDVADWADGREEYSVKMAAGYAKEQLRQLFANY